MKTVFIETSEDTARVIANACLTYAQDNPPTRDTAIALQVTASIAHKVHPDENRKKPTRLTDEPLPIVSVKPDPKRKGCIFYRTKDGVVHEITEIKYDGRIMRVNDGGVWEEVTI